jgi:hypothetical protein
MIVRRSGDRLRLITQPDHAHLARRIMERAAGLVGHPRRLTILHAIGEHDNGWAEPDASPTVVEATGAIADFVTAPADVRQGVWPRGLSRLASDPWAAALVAQHALTVYDRHRSDPGWTTFFDGLARARDRLLGAGGGSPGDLAADYVFVRLGDLISLAFCTGEAGAQSFGGWTVAPAGARVHVSPDPFDGSIVPIEIVGRELPDRRYGSDGELRTALDAAPEVLIRGEVAGR